MVNDAKFILLVAVSAGVFAYLEMSKEGQQAAARGKPVSVKSRVTVGPNGEGRLMMDDEMQKRIVLETQAVDSAR